MQKKLYCKLLTLLYNSKSEHIGSCLSCLDILIQTFLFEMKSEDKFILSKGHAAPALYIILWYLKKLTDKQLNTFYQDRTKLPAHPPRKLAEEVPFPTGSLGHGLSLSAGIAEGMRYNTLLKKEKTIPRIFCLISDGECNEGQTWEAAQYATQRKLSNLVVLIDNNKFQAFGKTKDVLGDAASSKKWKAFGFETFDCSGHNLLEIKEAFKKVNDSKLEKPKLINFHTTYGHGVSFMEGRLEWHYYRMNEQQYKRAIMDIQNLYED